jgi:hypothetical protein
MGRQAKGFILYLVTIGTQDASSERGGRQRQPAFDTRGYKSINFSLVAT